MFGDDFYKVIIGHRSLLIVILLAQLCVGFESIYGNTLPYLAIRTGTPIDVVGYAITARSICFIFTASLSGLILFNLKNERMRFFTVAVMLLIGSITSVAIPCIHIFIFLVLVASLAGLAIGCLDTAHHGFIMFYFGSIYCRPMIFCLQTLTSFGALMVTFLVRIFLENGSEDIVAYSLYNTYCRNLIPSRHDNNTSNKTDAGNVTDDGESSSRHLRDFPKIFWPFSIVGLYHIVLSLLYFYLALRKKDSSENNLEMVPFMTTFEPEKQISHVTSNVEPNDLDLDELKLPRPNVELNDLSPCVQYTMTSLILLFFVIIGSKESTYWYELFTYGICGPLRMQPLDATTATHIFFMGFILARVTCIYFAGKFQPSGLLGLLLVCNLVAHLLLLMVGHVNNIVFYLIIFCISISMSPVPGCTMNWIIEMIPSPHRVSSIAFVGIGAGFTIVPTVAGHIILGPTGPRGIVYMVCSFSFLDVLTYVTLYAIYRLYIKQGADQKFFGMD